MSTRVLQALQDGLTAPMSPGERTRFLAGRYDWPDDRWEDHCGQADCGHDCCERAYIPETRSRVIQPWVPAMDARPRPHAQASPRDDWRPGDLMGRRR